MSTEQHSEWSASGFKQVMLCPGSKVLQKGLPRSTSIYAAEGTAAHTLLQLVLTGDTPASGFEGRVFAVDGFDIEVDADMVRYVQGVADFVRELVGADGVFMVEKRVCYADALGLERDRAWGTADVIIARGERLIVLDLKYGRGVEVEVETNPQAMLYGLGALDLLDGIAGEFTELELIIAQPRVSSTPSRWVTSVEDLRKWAATEGRAAVERAQQAEQHHGADRWEQSFLVPSEEACRFCKAKAACPALYREVSQAVSAAPATADEFDQVTDPVFFDDEKLAYAMSKADLIEDWITGVRAEVERRLLAGTAVPGFKLVAGKAGARAWTDAKEAEKMLREQFRLTIEQAYDLKLISPTSAEKLLAKESPRRWQKLQPLIKRNEGKPSVAPLSDKRPALEMKPVADDFAAIPETVSDLA